MTEAQSRGDGRVALVTGAASGIGRATALRFLEAGCAVAALDRNAVGLEGLAAKAPQAHRVLALPADLLDEERVCDALDRALAWKDRLDVVVNVAGISPPEELSTYSREDWADLVQTNLRGVFLVCQKTAPALARSGGAPSSTCPASWPGWRTPRSSRTGPPRGA